MTKELIDKIVEAFSKAQNDYYKMEVHNDIVISILRTALESIEAGEVKVKAKENILSQEQIEMIRKLNPDKQIMFQEIKPIELKNLQNPTFPGPTKL